MVFDNPSNEQNAASSESDAASRRLLSTAQDSMQKSPSNAADRSGFPAMLNRLLSGESLVEGSGDETRQHSSLEHAPEKALPVFVPPPFPPSKLLPDGGPTRPDLSDRRSNLPGGRTNKPELPAGGDRDDPTAMNKPKWNYQPGRTPIPEYQSFGNQRPIDNPKPFSDQRPLDQPKPFTNPKPFENKWTRPADDNSSPAHNERPLEPYQKSGFHTQEERAKFEEYAARKGFSPEAIRRAEHMSKEEWAAFDAINEDRARNGRPLLQFSPRVKLISDYQADRQAAARQMTHGNPGHGYNPSYPYHLDRLKRVGLGVDGMHDGENAAYGTRSGRAVTNMWLNSSGHLRPIRDGYLKIGAVSCAKSPEGVPYWTFNASTGKTRG